MHYIINGFSGNSVNFTTGNPDIFVFRVARGNFMGNASYLYRLLAFHMINLLFTLKNAGKRGKTRASGKFPVKCQLPI